ncbi:tyrosine-protein phosphatase [Enterococcus sp. LJL99]
MKNLIVEYDEKTKRGKLDLKTDFSGELDVFMSVDPFHFKKAKHGKAMFEKGVYDQEIATNEKKRIFYKVINRGEEYIGAKRRVPITGLYNCRDLGGYSTEDGKLTKWGMFYRSDAPDHLSQEDITYLEQMSFFSVVDLRSPAEIALRPGKSINERVHYNFDPNAEVAKQASESPAEKSAKDQAKVEKLVQLAQTQTGKDQLVLMQQQMVGQMNELVVSAEAKEAYKNFLKIILAEEVPILFHCQGGKDRTGWAAAILLGLLGVDKTTIYEDYLLTAIYNQPRNQSRMAIYEQYTDNSFVLNYLASLQQTKKSYLDSAFEAMEQKYGTMETYAVRALGISVEDCKKLRRMYLY